ncbi:MAG TPA: glycosyl hydrolase family 18 protein [Fimbriimonadaceae bacterium]|nr:glycosyl hydrolase family 18 protein [Fimbriimonadaceae bacterium]
MVALMAAFALGPAAHADPGKVVLGYVQDGDDTPDVVSQVDYDKVTHLAVAFANPSDDTGALELTPHLDKLVEAAHKKGVKIELSIGGGFASENKAMRERYAALLADAKRAPFVASLAKCIEDHKLDGLDVDLEGPAINKDYAAFVADLSGSLKPKGKLLTAAVSVGYGGPQITKEALACFDLVNVMAYDATGPWSPQRPGQHSSIELAKANVAYWIGREVPKEKLVLGVPFYGYGFGDAFTKDGYTYADIVAKFPGAEQLDQEGKTIWYNGIPTIQAKTQFVIDQGLAGVMIWSLNQDAKGKASLLSAIHAVLSKP